MGRALKLLEMERRRMSRMFACSREGGVIFKASSGGCHRSETSLPLYHLSKEYPLQQLARVYSLV